MPFVTLLLAMSFASLYTYITVPLYPHNLYWLLGALLLAGIGRYRNRTEALLATAVLLLGYGGCQIYWYYHSGGIMHFGWNELIWLAVFPYAALSGEMSKRRYHTEAATNSLSFYQQLQNAGDLVHQEISAVVEEMQFLVGTAFVYKLEEEILRTLRERGKFCLLLIEIDRFRGYKSMFGFSQSQLLLNQLARFMKEKLPETEVRAHLGEGTFAVILPILSDDAEQVKEFQDKLTEFFGELLMARPRQESVARIRLKYGTAVCPEEGIDARNLMDRAQQALGGDGKS